MFTRRRSIFAGLLLLLFTLVGAAPASWANDRELRATAIPPLACRESSAALSAGASTARLMTTGLCSSLSTGRQTSSLLVIYR